MSRPNTSAESSNSNWRPTSSLQNLKQRSQILAKIRDFFKKRDVLEVETPLLSHATVTDVHLQSFKTDYFSTADSSSESLYLQTSPEFAMKRLLAAGSGPIYQICKAFRNEGESGRFHNPEFTMLEWYRPGFDHKDLMDETDALLQEILQTSAAERYSYLDVFLRYTDLNPHTASIEDLKQRAIELKLPEIDPLSIKTKNDWLHYFMGMIIEPQLGRNRPTFIYDFPSAQAALARIRQDNPPVAERFEVYINGIELANGFHELTDPAEQEKRFLQDLELRKQMNYSLPPIDTHFLAALKHGLPNCAGIALGIDRLMLIAMTAKSIAEVVSFTVDRA